MIFGQTPDAARRSAVTFPDEVLPRVLRPPIERRKCRRRSRRVAVLIHKHVRSDPTDARSEHVHQARAVGVLASICSLGLAWHGLVCCVIVNADPMYFNVVKI